MTRSALILAPASLILAALILSVSSVLAQTPVAVTPANQPEISAHDSPVTFTSRVNLVSVPVVVRDRKGRAIGNLTKDDFQLFDKGKPQVISRFSIEKAGQIPADEPAPRPTLADAITETKSPESDAGKAIPTRFVAYFFDDLHIDLGDLNQIRGIAIKHLVDTMKPTDRVAIFAASGIGVQDFTDDRELLISAIKAVTIRSHRAPSCPPLSFYQADQIFNQNNTSALNNAANAAIACENLINNTIGPGAPAGSSGPGGSGQAPTGSAAGTGNNLALAAASKAVADGEIDLQQTLNLIKNAVQRMSTLPGERNMVMISPGFLITSTFRGLESDLIDRAIRAKILINALNSGGIAVFYDPGIDGSGSQTASLTNPGSSTAVQSQATIVEDGTLSEFTDGTGGILFHNNNDYAEGLRRLGATPEFIYVLGFSPQNLKYDGKFHSIKVALKSKDLIPQARRGYYAPKHAANPEEQAKQEITEAMYSREDVAEFPIGLKTQFFKATADSAHITLLAHVDLKRLPFEKAAGFNNDTLDIVCGLFDSNGNILKAQARQLNMRLKDETYNAAVANGINIKTAFDARPGKYLLRIVVRDTQGEMISATNGVVEIP